MPNGHPLIDDLDVLCFCQDSPGFRDGWISALAQSTGLPYKQVFAHVSKKRFAKWIDYGICLERGWLTPAGKTELARLMAKVAPPIPGFPSI